MNPADVSFKELETILAKECEAHEQLLGAAASINSAIKESDLATLQQHTANLDEQVFQIGQLEEERKTCCSALSRALGLTAQGAVKLTAIIERAPAAIREKLAALQTLLKNALSKISHVNVSNRILLEEGLQLVHGQLKLMTQPGIRYTHYQSRGDRATSALPYHPFINRTI
jgi:hypothetical protein